MEDMDDVRKPIGTVADFSDWKGVSAEGNFRHMKVSSSEKVIEPVENETGTSEEDALMNGPVEPPVIKRRKAQPQVVENSGVIESPRGDMNMREQQPQQQSKSFDERPGAVRQAYLNPAELKQIAVKLMPTAEKIAPSDYEKVSEYAINLAFTFLNVWNQKVQVGEGNEQEK